MTLAGDEAMIHLAMKECPFCAAAATGVRCKKRVYSSVESPMMSHMINQRILLLVLTLFSTGAAAFPEIPFCPIGGPPGWFNRIAGDDHRRHRQFWYPPAPYAMPYYQPQLPANTANPYQQPPVRVNSNMMKSPASAVQ